jgi:hypothetical protein
MPLASACAAPQLPEFSPSRSFSARVTHATDSDVDGRAVVLEGRVTTADGYGKSGSSVDGATVTAASVGADGQLAVHTEQTSTNAEGRFELGVTAMSDVLVVSATKRQHRDPRARRHRCGLRQSRPCHAADHGVNRRSRHVRGVSRERAFACDSQPTSRSTSTRTQRQTSAREALPRRSSPRRSRLP